MITIREELPSPLQCPSNTGFPEKNLEFLHYFTWEGSSRWHWGNGEKDCRQPCTTAEWHCGWQDLPWDGWEEPLQYSALSYCWRWHADIRLTPFSTTKTCTSVEENPSGHTLRKQHPLHIIVMFLQWATDVPVFQPNNISVDWKHTCQGTGWGEWWPYHNGKEQRVFGNADGVNEVGTPEWSWRDYDRYICWCH